MLKILKDIFNNKPDLFFVESLNISCISLNRVEDKEKKIVIEIDEENNLLSIFDNGKGLDEDELKIIGTFNNEKEYSAHLEKLSLIQQLESILNNKFGFYASFVVSTRIEIITKKEDGCGCLLDIDTDGIYKISKIDVDSRGTTIKYYIKEEFKKFLDIEVLSELIYKNTDFINYDIDISDKKLSIPIKVKDKMLYKSIEKRQEKEYYSLYNRISSDDEIPLNYINFKEDIYDVIIYIPQKSSFSVFQSTYIDNNLKIFHKGRYLECISSNLLLPDWLSFLHIIINMDKIVTPDELSNFKDILEDKVIDFIIKQKSEAFYKYFGINIKIAIYKKYKYKSKLIDLLRFKTTKNMNPILLSEYEGKDVIYFISGSLSSPFLEKFINKGIEVIIVDTPIDDICINSILNKKLVSISRTDVICPHPVFLNEDINEEYKFFFNKIKDILENKVSNVIISNKLIHAPCILSTDKDKWSFFTENVMKKQILIDQMHILMNKSDKILELNMDNDILKKIFELHKKGEDFSKQIYTIYNIALISSGDSIDSTEFVCHTLYNSLL